MGIEPKAEVWVVFDEAVGRGCVAARGTARRREAARQERGQNTDNWLYYLKFAGSKLLKNLVGTVRFERTTFRV